MIREECICHEGISPRRVKLIAGLIELKETAVVRTYFVRCSSCEKGHSTGVAMLTVEVKVQEDRLTERSTGASNPDDIASRYITRNFMAYYRTAYGI